MHRTPLILLLVIAFVVTASISNFVAAVSAGVSVPVSMTNLKNKLLFLRAGNIWTYDVEKNIEAPLTHTINITNYSISSDASKMAFFKDHKKLYLYDVATGSEELIVEVTTDASQPTLSPHGDKIAFIGYARDKVTVKFSYFTKPISQHIRHIWIADAKTKNIVDITGDIPYQHSQVNWSPDGKWLSFASYRFGLLDKLNLFSSKDWSVYLMDLDDPRHKTTEISGGMGSVWVNNDQVRVLDGMYNVKTKTMKPAVTAPEDYSSPLFFGGVNNEVVYYEVISDDPDENVLIRSHNMRTNMTEDVIKNASVPRYVK